MRIWITEYGYQTNPTDTIFGVPVLKQASYLTQAVAFARKHPRIDMFLWFLLRDEQRLGGLAVGPRRHSTACASPASPRSAAPRRVR